MRKHIQFILFTAVSIFTAVILYSHFGKKPEHVVFPISVGILTHYAPKTLRHTLESYKRSGFLDVVEDVFVVLQKSDRQIQEIEVCSSFHLRHIVMPDNGAMSSGFQAIYNHAKKDTILFLENDFSIQVSKQEVIDFLSNAMYFLHVEGCDYVRGRSRKYPGSPNIAYTEWKDLPPQTFLREHGDFLSESIYWDPTPEKTYPSQIQRVNPIVGSEPWYCSLAKHCNYTNNPFVCRRSFFQQAILPHLKFGEGIEGRLMPIWAKQNYLCVFGPGLFTHDRSYDGHW